MQSPRAFAIWGIVLRRPDFVTQPIMDPRATHSGTGPNEYIGLQAIGKHLQLPMVPSTFVRLREDASGQQDSSFQWSKYSIIRK